MTVLRCTGNRAESYLSHPASRVQADLRSNLPSNSQPALLLPRALGHIRQESETVTSRSCPKWTVNSQFGSQVARFWSAAIWVIGVCMQGEGVGGGGEKE